MQQIPNTLFNFFAYFIKKQWKGFLAAQIFSFGWALDHTLWPLVLMLLIDVISNYTGDRTFVWSALALPISLGISLWILVESFFRLAGVVMAYIIPKMEADMRLSMFNYVQRHSYTYFSNHFAGTIANKISDMPQSATRILEQIITLFLPVVLALIISSVLFAFVNPLFSLILVSWIFVHTLICLSFSKRCDSYSRAHAQARTGLTGKIVDSLGNHLNTKLFARHRFEYDFLTKAQNEEQEKHFRSLIYIEKMKFALGIASFLGAGITLNWFMIYQWQLGNLSTGEVVFIFNTTWNITMMAWTAGLELPSLFREIGICRQSLTIIQDPHDITDKSPAGELKASRGEIVFDNVTFRYMRNHAIFEDKTLTIHAGEKVGLVGFSGSGKTTFVNLILRYFDINKGRILIDGQDISQVTQDSLRSQIAMIPQDAILFHRTLMENIRYGRLDATDEEVIDAAKQAHCHEFIARLSEGYHTLVGERGTKLSGGQRQRIAIARAILKNAPILILDEATSSLDSVTEKLIQESLEHLMQGRTTLVIAHRLSTLSGMDKIIVFKDGKIVESGTHDELLASEGHYAMIWTMQAGGFLWDEDSEAEDDEVESAIPEEI